MRQQYVKRFWLLMVLGISAALTACGGAGSEEPKPKLKDSDYVLEITGQLEAGQFDPAPVFWVQTIKDIPADMAWSLDWYQPGFTVAEDGRYTISVDAREIVGQALDPELFAQWYLWPVDAEVMDISVSDGSASLRALQNIVLNQRDPVSDTGLASYDLDFLKENQWARPVFSDKDVKIQGTVGAPASAPRAKVDMSIQAGWNLVYTQPGTSAPAAIEYVSRPFTTGDQPQLRLRYTDLVIGIANPFAGYSSFPAHELQLDASPSYLTSSTQSREIKVRSWFSTGDAKIVALAQAFPGTGSVEPSDPDSRGLLVSILYYDESAIATDGWFRDPSLSAGSLAVTSETGNAILFVYSDRPVSLNVSNLVLESDPTKTLRATDLELTFGWNFIEAKPSTGTPNTFDLVSHEGVPTQFSLEPRD